MLEHFTLKTFSPHVGETFHLYLDTNHVIEVQLADVTDLAQRYGTAPQGHRTPFSIVFHGPRELVLPQRIYRLQHDKIGTFEVFLVPIGPDADRMQYEAIFT
jgi:hypothetical protein